MLTDYSQALIPSLLRRPEKTVLNRLLSEGLSLMAGVLLLSLLARVAFPLPGTPVPVTGQTMGVALLSLSWGARRSVLTFVIYLLMGSLGLPLFAMGASGVFLGPTLGYLIGMLLACSAMGVLADRGWTRSLSGALSATYVGSFITFTCGLFVLSFFLPWDQLVMAGLLPFLPGDLIKNLIAASCSWTLRRRL